MAGRGESASMAHSYAAGSDLDSKVAAACWQAGMLILVQRSTALPIKAARTHVAATGPIGLQHGAQCDARNGRGRRGLTMFRAERKAVPTYFWPTPPQYVDQTFYS